MLQSASGDIFDLQGVASKRIDKEAESQWLRQHFELPYNPFPPSGISPDIPEGPPLKDEQGRDIAPIVGGFIVSAYRDRAPRQGLVIVGTYGTGKTHLLRLIHNQINERLGSGEEKALSIYVQRPRVEVQDLNREILRGLGEDTVRKMLWYCIRKEVGEDITTQSPVLMELRDELIGPLFGYQAKKGHDESPFAHVFQVDNLEDYRTFFRMYDAQGWPREKLRDYFSDLFNRSLEAQSPLEVVEAFIALLLAPDEKSRASWESLLALGKKHRVPLMAAPEFLKDLLKLIQMNGYVYTFLLIDEFEEVPAGYLLTKRQQADYMYTLMEMLNKIERGLGLVLAITPQAWEVLTALAPPLKDRLPIVVRLGDLDAASIGQLISVYLEWARRDAGIEVEDRLFPFSNALVDQIARKMPERTPRNILQLAYQIVTHCVASRKTSLTPETIEAVLRDYLEMKKTVETEKRRLGGR